MYSLPPFASGNLVYYYIYEQNRATKCDQLVYI